MIKMNIGIIKEKRQIERVVVPRAEIKLFQTRDNKLHKEYHMISVYHDFYKFLIYFHNFKLALYHNISLSIGIFRFTGNSNAPLVSAFVCCLRGLRRSPVIRSSVAIFSRTILNLRLITIVACRRPLN